MTTMTNLSTAITAITTLSAGLLLGLFFFIGLWWTIRRALDSPHPALWFVTSLLLRLAITSYGLYWVADGRWQRLLWCCGGFILSRWLVRRFIPAPPTKEAICS